VGAFIFVSEGKKGGKGTKSSKEGAVDQHPEVESVWKLR
jgi:hypothetical protein